MRRLKGYTPEPSEQSGFRTFVNPKSDKGLPTDSDREKEQVLPPGSATPKSPKKDEGDEGGGRNLPSTRFNGPDSDSNIQPRSLPQEGGNYGSPSKDDYGFLTRRTMTGEDEEPESDKEAYKRRRPWRRQRRQPIRDRMDDKRKYKTHKNPAIRKVVLRYKRDRRNPAFKDRKEDYRENPNRYKRRKAEELDAIQTVMVKLGYTPWSMGKRRHKHVGPVRQKRRQQYRKNRAKAHRQHHLWYQKNRHKPAFRRRQKIRHQNPSRFRLRPASVLTTPEIAFVMGREMNPGFVHSVSSMSGMVTFTTTDLALGRTMVMSLPPMVFLSSVVFLSDADVDAMFELIDVEMGEDAYVDLTPHDVHQCAQLYGVDPDGGEFRELCEKIVGTGDLTAVDDLMPITTQIVTESLEDWGHRNMDDEDDHLVYGDPDEAPAHRVAARYLAAGDILQIDRVPPGESFSEWSDKGRPSEEREKADERPYREQGPGQWTRTGPKQTRKPTPPDFTTPDYTVPGGSGKVIPNDLQHTDRFAAQLVRQWKFGLEFPTKDALKKYLSDHPMADRSKHSVVESEGGGADTSDEPDLGGELNLHKYGARHPSEEDDTEPGSPEWLESHSAQTSKGSAVLGTLHSGEGLGHPGEEETGRDFVKNHLVPQALKFVGEALKAGKTVTFLAEGNEYGGRADDEDEGDNEQAAVSYALSKEYGNKFQEDTWDGKATRTDTWDDEKGYDQFDPKLPINKKLIKQFGDPALVEAAIFANNYGQGSRGTKISKDAHAYLKKQGFDEGNLLSKKQGWARGKSKEHEKLQAELYKLTEPRDYKLPDNQFSRVSDAYARLRQENLVRKMKQIEAEGGIALVTPGATHAYGLKRVFETHWDNIGGSAKTAATMSELADGTAQRVHDRQPGDGQVKLKRADAKNGIWTFQVTGSKGNLYTVRVKGKRARGVKILANADVQVSCSCPFYRWQGPEHWAKVEDYMYGKYQGTASVPKVRDPQREHLVCKHALACLEVAKTYRMDPAVSRVASRFLEAHEEVVLYPAGWGTPSDEALRFLDSIGGHGSVFRGMTEREYRATVGAGKPVWSTGKYSHHSEGTNFASDAQTAVSYVNFGRDDPRKTGRPNYLVMAKRIPEMVDARDGYVKSPVPVDTVQQVWKTEAKGDEILMQRIR